jgi:hypothetical protein
VIDSYAVSSLTGYGINYFAKSLLEKLGGRDVFVIGAANVGKSTLVKKLSDTIATHIVAGYQAARRLDALEKINVTASHLPGTTLQAVRVPCFKSKEHALWDTPGVIAKTSISYSLLPSHFMEPLIRPTSIPIRPSLRLRPGETLLLEADWMKTHGEQPATLARLDCLQHDSSKAINIECFVPSSVSVRIVDTLDAARSLVIPPKFAESVRALTKLNTTRSISPLAFKSYNTVTPAPPNKSGWRKIEVAFASLGHISLSSKDEFVVDPMAAEGSVWFKRRPMYPSDIRYKLDEGMGMEESLFDDVASEEGGDRDDLRTKLRRANRDGQRLSNKGSLKTKKEKSSSGVLLEGGYWDSSGSGVGDDDPWSKY